jgi:hypothetical protein
MAPSNERTATETDANEDRALSLLQFIREYAPNLHLAETSLTSLQRTPRLRGILVLPLPSCRRAPHLTRAECREPVPTIVDDVVWTLVQRRERLNRLKQRRPGLPRQGATTVPGGPPGTAVTPGATGGPDGRGVVSGPSPHLFLEGGGNALARGFAIPQGEDWAAAAASAAIPGRTMRHGVACVHPNENVAYCKSSSLLRRVHVMVGDELLRTIFLHTRLLFPLLTCNSSRRNGMGDGPTTTTTTSNRTNTTTGNGSFEGNYLLLCGPPLVRAVPTVRSSKEARGRALDSAVRCMKKRKGGDNIVRCGCCEEGGVMVEDRPPPRKKRRTRKKTALARATSTVPLPGPVTAAVVPVAYHPSHTKMGPNDSISRFPLFYFDNYIPRVGLPKSHPFEQCRSQPMAGQRLYEMLMHSMFDLARESNKNKPRRLRKRLAHSFPVICDGILQGHRRCDYARLLERYCSMPLLPDASIPDDEDGANPLARLAQAYTSRDHVAAFLGATLKRVFPLEFWGSQGNFDSMMTSVHAFVHLRRKERLANKNIMRGVRVTKMKWLFDGPSSVTLNLHGASGGKRHGTPKARQRSNHEMASRLTLQVLRWVFQGFIIPLLRSNFYVTETEFSAQQIQYYRKPVWALFRSLALQKLFLKQQQHQRQGHFEQISFVEARATLLTHGRQMGLSRLRLLPKRTGMRPIAQLSRSQNYLKILFPLNGIPKTRSEASSMSSLFTSSATKRSRDGDIAQTGPAAVTKKRRLQGSTSHLSQSSELAESNCSLRPQGPSRLPTNMILGQVFDILRYECSQNDQPFGVGMDSLASFYPRYQSYITSLRTKDWASDRGKLKLHFASVDIEKCYDRMDQDWLLHLVEKLVSQSSYVVQQLKMEKCCASSSRTPTRLTSTSTQYKKLVRPLVEYNPLHTGQHPFMDRDSTVFDLFKCSIAERTKIMSLLGEHIRSHMVVTGGRYQRKILLQASGISQGSVLSTTLCNLYYGFVEKSMFKGPLTKPGADDEVFSVDHENSALSDGTCDGGGEEDFMARFVDDFVFISPDPNSLRVFLAKACRGKPDLGAEINPDKSLVSADVTLPCTLRDRDLSLDASAVRAIKAPSIAFPTCNRKNRHGNVLFPWCGLLFDTDTGEVRMDYERFHGGRVRDSLTVDFDGSEGKKMKLRMQSFVVPRCLPILYDSSINSHDIVITNFYQMMLLTAAKTAEYLRTQNAHHRYSCRGREPSDCKLLNVDHLINCIHDLPAFASWNIQRILKNTCLSTRGAQFCINTRVAASLTWEAFYQVFSYLVDFENTAQRILAESPSLEAPSVSRNKKASTIRLRSICSNAFEDFRLRHMISSKP